MYYACIVHIKCSNITTTFCYSSVLLFRSNQLIDSYNGLIYKQLSASVIILLVVAQPHLGNSLSGTIIVAIFPRSDQRTLQGIKLLNDGIERFTCIAVQD